MWTSISENLLGLSHLQDNPRMTAKKVVFVDIYWTWDWKLIHDCQLFVANDGRPIKFFLTEEITLDQDEVDELTCQIEKFGGETTEDQWTADTVLCFARDIDHYRARYCASRTAHAETTDWFQMCIHRGVYEHTVRQLHNMPGRKPVRYAPCLLPVFQSLIYR